jgi:hypothetical protein
MLSVKLCTKSFVENLTVHLGLEANRQFENRLVPDRSILKAFPLGTTRFSLQVNGK